MLQICHEDKEKVYTAIRSEHIDAANLSFPCLIDTIILTMKRHGLLAALGEALQMPLLPEMPFTLQLCFVWECSAVFLC